MTKTEDLFYPVPTGYETRAPYAISPLLEPKEITPPFSGADQLKPASAVEDRSRFVATSSHVISIATPREAEAKKRKTNLAEIVKNIVDTLQNVRNASTEEQTSLIDSKVHELMEENKKATQLHIDKMNEHKELSHWDLFRKIITCIGSALSIVLGGALIVTGAGTAAGAALIVAGTLGITSFVLGEVGVNPAIVGGLAIAGAAVGLGASIYSFTLMTQQLPAIMTSVAGAITAIGTGTSKIGISYHQHRISLMDAKNTDFDQAIALHKSDIQMELGQMEHLTRQFEQSAQTTAAIAREYQQLTRYISQTYLG